LAAFDFTGHSGYHFESTLCHFRLCALSEAKKCPWGTPTPDAGNKAIAFGDFSYYWIADRQGRFMKRLSDSYISPLALTLKENNSIWLMRSP